MATTLCQADLSGNASSTNLNAYTPQTGDVNAAFTKELTENFVQNASGNAFYLPQVGSGPGTSLYVCNTALPGSGVGVLTCGITADKLSNVSFTQAGIVIGWVDNNNHLKLVAYWDGAATQVALVKVVAGSETSIATVGVTWNIADIRRVELDYDTASDNAKLYFYDPTGSRVQIGTGGGYSVSGVTVLGEQVGIFAAAFGTNDGATVGLIAAQYKAEYSGGAGATTFTLSGPTRGPAGAASSTFTVTPDGATTATWTPNAQAGCTFTPSTLTLAGTTPKTFTVTRATAGSSTINGTASGLTPPTSISYTAATTTTGNFSYQDATPSTAVTYVVRNTDGTGWSNSTSAGTSSSTGTGVVTAVVIPSDYVGYIEFANGSVFATDVLTPPTVTGGTGFYRGGMQGGTVA